MENNIKEISIINDNIKKLRLNYKFRFKFQMNENEINKLLKEIEIFGKKSIQYIDDINKLNQITNIKDYFNFFSELVSNYNTFIIFFAAKDEFTCSLDENLRKQLKKIGINSDLNGKYRYSFYAVKGPNYDIEKLSEKKLSITGKILNDKISYSISSAGMDAGNNCSIIIDGNEYAKNKRGLNIVIYDITYHRIIYSVCFDTYEGLTCSR